eukprot:TRINITY_DN106875_c0_g1_i1.p1 TRINITY_DN106875_c0_g1~~TRINITY_DN106875_c0_g1_i1.p1  ORF type:complete len:266 (+),score=28.16 TRINITY_DN106875_c0_g1_i1:56-853(+)
MAENLAERPELEKSTQNAMENERNFAFPWELPELVGETGAWRGRAGADLHHHDPGLAYAIACFLSVAEKPRRVIDMGCGKGDFVKALHAQGVNCDGFDGHADTAALTGGLCYTADFADDALPAKIAKVGYDWCLCLEVFEHVPMHLEKKLVNCVLAGTGRGLIISVATPGQGGLGHVNERPHEYVIDLLQGEGLEFDARTSGKLRKYAVLPWFQVNTLVFRRKPQPDAQNNEVPVMRASEEAAEGDRDPQSASGYVKDSTVAHSQ